MSFEQRRIMWFHFHDLLADRDQKTFYQPRLSHSHPHYLTLVYYRPLGDERPAPGIPSGLTHYVFLSPLTQFEVTDPKSGRLLTNVCLNSSNFTFSRINIVALEIKLLSQEKMCQNFYDFQKWWRFCWAFVCYNTLNVGESGAIEVYFRPSFYCLM